MGRLLAVVLVPTLVIAAVWNWAGERDAARPVVTVPSADVGGESDPVGMATSALSWRRIGAAITDDESADRRRSEFDELLAVADDETCVVIDDGSGPTAASDRPVALGPAQAVVVAAAAIVLLGPDHRAMTSLVGPPPVDGVIDGDVAVVGGGDALLGTATVSGSPRLAPLPVTPFDALAEALGLAGVVEITGDVVAVADRYDDVDRPTGWEVPVSDAARVGALLVDRGRIFTGPENFALDPAQGAARTLIEVLRERSISVGGSARTAAGSQTPEGDVLAVVAGEPLGEVIDGWLVGAEAPLLAERWAEFSDALLMEIGVSVAGSGTRLGGAAAVSALLEEASERPSEGGWTLAADLRDGPGLDIDSVASCGSLAWALTTLEGLSSEADRRIGLAVDAHTTRATVAVELPGSIRSRLVVSGPRSTVDRIVAQATRIHSDDAPITVPRPADPATSSSEDG
jgi:D-alanyl-D-alanine carboxypeptidase/D-alanyl-D-alanine-endopeptidase (penicillin-binding protein 4)